MNNILLSALLGYLTDFLGIGIGALCAFFILIIKKKYIKDKMSVFTKNVFFSFAFEFSSGLMMAVVTFQLIPDALEKCGYFTSIFGIFVGLIIVHIIGKVSNVKNSRFKTSIIVLINLWLHNIPEGFILGTTISSDIALTLLFFGAVLIHNIPQGVLITLPIIKENIKRKSIVYLSIFSGIPTAAGAFLGTLTGQTLPEFTGFMTSLAAGSMLYVLTFELSYEARKIFNRKIIEIAYIIGLILGIVIV